MRLSKHPASNQFLLRRIVFLALALLLSLRDGLHGLRAKEKEK